MLAHFQHQADRVFTLAGRNKQRRDFPVVVFVRAVVNGGHLQYPAAHDQQATNETTVRLLPDAQPVARLVIPEDVGHRLDHLLHPSQTGDRESSPHFRQK